MLINEKGDAEETNERVLVIAGKPCASIIIRPDLSRYNKAGFFIILIDCICLRLGPKKCCCDCLAMIIEKLVEGGCEFSHYDEDHHMSMISNSVPSNGTSASRTSRDREGKGRDSGRTSPAGRPPRRVVQATEDSRSQSPVRSRSTRDSRDRDWERDKDRDRRAAHDSDRHGSRGRHSGAGADRDDYSREDRERSDHRGPRGSSDRSVFLSYADGNGIAVNRSRPSSASYSSTHTSIDTTTSRSRALSDGTTDSYHAHGHATSSPSSSYVDYNPPLGPDFNNSKIQRIVKGSRNNSQAGIPLRTKAQVGDTRDQLCCDSHT